MAMGRSSAAEPPTGSPVEGDRRLVALGTAVVHDEIAARPAGLREHALPYLFRARRRDAEGAIRLQPTRQLLSRRALERQPPSENRERGLDEDTARRIVRA